MEEAAALVAGKVSVCAACVGRSMLQKFRRLRHAFSYHFSFDDTPLHIRHVTLFSLAGIFIETPMPRWFSPRRAPPYAFLHI